MKTEVEFIGVDKFYRALESMVATGKRSAEEVIYENFKGVIRNLLAITPPMGGKTPDFKLNAKGQKTGGINFAAGKRRGQDAIEVDIQKAFRRAQKTTSSSFGSEQEALSWYLGARNYRKRIKGKPKRAAQLKQINFVRKSILARQGSVAAGWSKAAAYFGITLPKWVERHGMARSRLIVERSEFGYYLTAINMTTHHQSNQIERIGQIAMNIQTENMMRQIESYIKKQAAAAGFTA